MQQQQKMQQMHEQQQREIEHKMNEMKKEMEEKKSKTFLNNPQLTKLIKMFKDISTI